MTRDQYIRQMAEALARARALMALIEAKRNAPITLEQSNTMLAEALARGKK